MLLIISKKKSTAATIAEMIRYSGVVCYPAALSEGLSEIGTMYRAVVIIDPDEFPDPEDYIKRIRSYLSNIPIFALYSRKEFIHLPYFDESYTSLTYSATFISKLSEYSVKKGYSGIGDYRLAGINASPKLPSVTFFDKAVNLTKTEAMILRFLMRSYPIPRKPKAIIKYVYKPSCAPDEMSIRAHICGINKKFHRYIQRNLIKSPDRNGYVIYTPELMEKYGI